MILERHRELTINLGNQTYESAKISARVTLDDEKDLAYIAAAGGSIDKAADQLLTEALASEVKYWHEITTKPDSFIHLVHQDNEQR